MHYPKEIRFSQLLNPAYVALQDLDGSGDLDSIIDKIVENVGISDETADILHGGSGSQTEMEYQLAWVKHYFKKVGILDKDSSLWVMTPEGNALGVDAAMEKIRIVRKAEQQARAKNKEQNKKTKDQDNIDEPDEECGESLPEWKVRLSEVLKNMNPYAFERLSRRLIQECGFSHVTVTKKSGDGGIDGYGKLKINGIFTFNVAFQCKRYSGTVPTSDIRDFRGSLTTDIEKGIFITTGKFSREAEKEASDKGKKQIDLIDGDEFMDKIAEYRIGVKPVTTYEVDEDFFEKI